MKDNKRAPSLIILVGSLVVITTVLGLSATHAEEGGKLNLIKDAIIRNLCYDVYWGGAEFYNRNVHLPLVIRIEDAKFYAKVEDVGYLGKKQISLYQIGLVKTGYAVVTHNFEYGIKKRFQNNSVIHDSLTIPSDCTPHYDSSTPQKELMLCTVVNTVQRQLSSWVKQGIVKYPREVTLIIADFNVDYPSTYILAEPINKVFTVTLHDPQNYDSDKYERSGEYPFGEQYNKSKSLLSKIRKHGIVRKIVLAN